MRICDQGNCHESVESVQTQVPADMVERERGGSIPRTYSGKTRMVNISWGVCAAGHLQQER